MELKDISNLVAREVGSISRLFKPQTRKQGTAPGELIHVGETREAPPRITILDYSEPACNEQADAEVEACLPYRDTETVTWINVDGVHDTALIERLGRHFGLHPLVMEDIVNTGQRPKLEEHDAYLYVVLKMLSFDTGRHVVAAEQVSLIIGSNFVISFQEREGDVFDPVRKRIRQGGGRVRTCGSDYLAYVLLDAIVDGYFAVIEQVGEMVEVLDAEVLAQPTPGTAHAIQRLRTELILLRKSVWPLRETVSALQRQESDLISAMLKPYLGDLYDHTIQVADGTEMLRDLVSGLRDTYLSSLSNRMNEVMQVLTIIATIFIPVTFIAGIYGMNFEVMPELKWPHGYYLALGAMATVAGGMVLWFRRRGWL